ncbi:FAD-dependent oxidoreductase [Nocardiopsis sp. RSe5-2]|uniref:FAD-dependent oxidoreductase n=1 Tax=Nocardiopsis endophytica TaxID=3018445 RepID=A0ABT4U9T0_9ACTN|nr:FAD-dependent oxidoreductase [Nocardiopsis endophytica]MDA2813102.1 FAD-dependent oxidoreductase [Nocardiopsis endophytica]
MTQRAKGPVVIVGAGIAGQQVALGLREKGFDGAVALVGEEPGAPYERPPLTKAYLRGDIGPGELEPRPAELYGRERIDLVRARAERIDRAGRAVVLDDGRRLPYDRLVLATGARNRPLRAPGSDLEGVFSLRTRREADALREALEEAGSIVVAGAGFIGLEFAASASAYGHKATIVESRARPLGRAVSAHTAAHFTSLHERHGAGFVFGEEVRALHGDRAGRVREAELTDGTRLPADLVLAAVGAAPDTRLAEGAGLPVDDGVAVDARLGTRDPRVLAVGDCAAVAPASGGGPRVRLESVQNALDQAEYAAERLARPDAGEDLPPYERLPWFWSDQYGSSLQIAGLAAGHDRAVLVGDGDEAFSVLLYRNGALAAVESVNRPAEHMAARHLLAAGRGPSPEQAAAPGFSLRAFARAAA